MTTIVHLARLVAVLGLILGTGCAARNYSLPPASKTQIYPSITAGAAAGKVVREGSQEALANVIVEVFSRTGRRPMRVGRTDALGRFHFKIEPGFYILQFSLMGFDRVRQPIEITASGTSEIEVGLPLGT